MAELRGNIVISRRLLTHEICQTGPANYLSGWLQLIGWANDRDRTVMFNGETVQLKRGQLAWSLRRLEKEWDRSPEWVSKYLAWLRERDMIRVDSTRRGTIITLQNYDAYQPKPSTEPSTEQVTEQGTEQGLNRELRKEKEELRRGEEPPPKKEFSILEEVGAFCVAYEDSKRGIKGIPEGWWTGWLASCLENDRPLPKNWQEVVKLRFMADLAAGHPKAVEGLPGLESKKNAPASPDGQSPAQRRFMLTRELAEVSRRLDECHELVMEPDPADVLREKELKAAIAALGVQATGGAQ